MITYLPCRRRSGKTNFLVNLCIVTDRAILMVADSRRMRDIVGDFNISPNHIILPQQRELDAIPHDITIFVDELQDIPVQIQERLHGMPHQVFAVGEDNHDNLIAPVSSQMLDERRTRAEEPNFIPPANFWGEENSRPARRRVKKKAAKKAVKKKAVKKKVSRKNTRFDMLEME